MQERLLLLLLLLLVHSSTANTQLVQVSEMLREHEQTATPQSILSRLAATDNRYQMRSACEYARGE